METGREPEGFKSNHGRTNYARLCRVIKGLCTQVLRDVLSRHIPPYEISQRVKQCPGLRLTRLQNEIVGTATVYAYQDFDISLLFALIRNLCPDVRPTNGWSREFLPTPTETTEGDDVERVRFVQNKVFDHMVDTSIPDTTFAQYWQILQGVMSRVDSRLGTNYRQILSVIKSDPMDVINEKMRMDSTEELKRPEKDLQVKNTAIYQLPGAPMEIMQMDEQSIQFYKESLENGTIKVYNTQVMVVGPQGVGKTLLTKRLLNIDVQLDIRQPTNSIDTHVHKCVISLPEGKWIVHPENLKHALRIGRKLGKFLIEHRTSKTFQQHTKHHPQPELFASPQTPQSPQSFILDNSLSDLDYFEDTVDCIRSEGIDKNEEYGEVSIWDFGGDFVFYTTHQTYLTQRAVYLVVLDMSKGLEDYVEGIKPTSFDVCGKKRWQYKDYLIFWLNSLDTFAKGAPVIFVATHLDIFQGTLETFFQRVKSTLIEEDGNLTWINRCQCFAVDNTIIDPTIEQLQLAIFERVKNQQYWGEVIPAKWVILEQILNQKKEKIMSIQEIMQGDPKIYSSVDKEQEIRLFLRFHHTLGNLIFFDNEQVGDKVVLDPKWVIDAFRCIISREEFFTDPAIKLHWKNFAETAELTNMVLNALWGERFLEYKTELLNVMIHIGIIGQPSVYRGVKDNKPEKLTCYVVPSLIKQAIPDNCIQNIMRKKSIFSSMLVYKFGKYLAPVIYSRLLSHCINKWQVTTHDKLQLFTALGSFDLDMDGSKILLISIVENIIQLQIMSNNNLGDEDCIAVRKFVDNVLNSILNGPLQPTDNDTFMICHYIKCPSEDFRSNLNCIPLKKLYKSSVYICCRDAAVKKHVHFPRDLVKYWFEDREMEEMEEKYGNENPHAFIQESLIAAVMEGDESEVMHLVRCGANIHIPDNNGKLAIHHATQTGNMKIVQKLLDLGASANNTDGRGTIPLHTAAGMGTLDVIKLLMQYKASQFLADTDGKTPIVYAVVNNHLEIVKFLLDKGASVSNVDANCKTLLHYAAEQNNEDIIKYIAEHEQAKYEVDEVCLRQLEIAVSLPCRYLGKIVIESVLESYFKKKRTETLQSLMVSRTLESLKMICRSFEETYPENIIKAWPAYQNHLYGPVYIVVYVTDIPESTVCGYMGLDVKYRLYDYVNEEARSVRNSNLAKDNQMPHGDYIKIKEVIDQNALNLRSSHSNLTFVFASSVKSSVKGSSLRKKKCIALHCRFKGMIPFGEEPFPKTIEHYSTDIREGFVVLNSNIPGRNVNPASTDWHDYLRMGCSISRQGCKNGSGTIGGFVELDDKLHFLTCAHVVFTHQECTLGMIVTENDPNQCVKVCQPGETDPGADRYTASQKICGTVVKAEFCPDRHVSVDAALVEINENRYPAANEFIGIDSSQLKACGFDGYPDMTEIPVIELPSNFASDDLHRAVFKVGSRSGITRGLIRPDGTRAFASSEDMVEFANRSKIYEIKNQIEIEPLGGSVFNIAGDSGSLVFMRKNQKNHCLGMAHASRSDGKTFVTPIKEIFDALKIPVTSLRGYHDGN